MAKPNPSIIAPGASHDFIYVGEMIPNQVVITNLDAANGASFEITSGVKSWTYYGTIGKGRTTSVFVRWPSGRARFTNNSVANASIQVGGNGIFPTTPKLRAAKIKAKIKKKKAGRR